MPQLPLGHALWQFAAKLVHSPQQLVLHLCFDLYTIVHNSARGRFSTVSLRPK
jgi:hypothetical protein